jgi:hypothetical protein
MATRVETSTGTTTASKTAMISLPLIAGWLVPGLGHVLVKRPVRGAILFATITLMFVLGILMQGKLYVANPGDLLEMLGFVGDLGSGLLFIIGRFADLGHAAVQIATADYGTKFIVVAGLLNFIAAIDAHNISVGRKQ